MKVLLAAVNAKYIHSNLAVYSLRAYAQKCMRNGLLCAADLQDGQAGSESCAADLQIDLAEYTINQQQDEIMRDIYERTPDVLCVSCYIWNMTQVESLVREIRKVLPALEIWLGGPEVSYDARAVLARCPAVRGVMMGEGELTFAELCGFYAANARRNAGESAAVEVPERNTEDAAEELPGKSVVVEIPEDAAAYTEEDAALAKIQGIAWRGRDGVIRENAWRAVADLSELPFVYEAMEEFEHRIIYYETSRGCPFSCSYCLSSVDKHLRFRDLRLVERELQFFLDRRVEQVKFVDRTFNCRHGHALAVWNYIAQHDNGVTNFHFEISADLLNEEELSLLNSLRPGLVQLEIGVQSTNPATIREIGRTMDFERLAVCVDRIRGGRNIHQHLDLIAGLPYEDIGSFAHSFDDVYALRPDQLQLGFLKVLKGSRMEEKSADYGLICKSAPPYEVLCTDWLSYEDVLTLKGVEEMVEVYYNSGQFTNTMEALAAEYDSAYRMYRELWDYYQSHGLTGVSHRRSARYEILLGFIREKKNSGAKDRTAGYFRELLTYDYYLRENAKSRPEFAGENAVSREFLRRFYEQEEQERRYLPAYAQYDRNQLRKMTHLEYFPALGRTILFDYLERSPLSHEARTCEIR